MQEDLSNFNYSNIYQKYDNITFEQWADFKMSKAFVVKYVITETEPPPYPSRHVLVDHLGPASATSRRFHRRIHGSNPHARPTTHLHNSRKAPAMFDIFMRPIEQTTINEREKLSAAYMLSIQQLYFLDSSLADRREVSTKPWSQAVIGPWMEHLKAKGVTIHMNATVEGLRFANGTVTGEVTLSSTPTPTVTATP